MMDDDSERDPVELLAEEFLERRRHEPVSPEDYAKKYPELADRIRTVFPALLMLDDYTPAYNARQQSEKPKQLGEFRIIRQIGRGGMGIVYEAVQETLDRRVALKVLPPESAQDAVYLDRFRSEARTAARLHHTNIVAIHGAGLADGVHFLVMQLINGVGLDAIISDMRAARNGPQVSISDRTITSGLSATDNAGEKLDLNNLYDHNRPAYYRAIARMMAEAADALAHAHQLGVVHRDIKPSNLLLERGGSLFVSDFGLAKAEGAADLTRTGLVVGTPRYVAPERFSGGEGPPSDVFALGATLYELLTLRPAFDAPTRDRLIEQIRNVEPAKPRTIVGDVPHDLETLTIAALTKLPNRRPSATALADDLRRWLAGRPVRARRIGPVERLSIWARRNPLVASLITGLFLTMVVGLAVSLTLWRMSEGHRRAAEHQANEADQQRAQAEASLTGALNALDEYYTKVSENKLLNKSGLQPLRHELMTSALKYYQGFLVQHENDPRLQRETARALNNLSAIELLIGTKERARVSREAAVAACRKLIEQYPDDVDARRQLGAACHGLAIVRLFTNQTESAIELFRESARQYSRSPELKDQDSCVQTLCRAAEAANEAERPQQAATDVKQARAVFDQMKFTDVKNASRLALKARVDSLSATILHDSRPEESFALLQSACADIEPLVAANPDHQLLRRQLGNLYYLRSTYELALKRLPDAANSIAAGRALLVRLVEENPEVRDYHYALAHNDRQAAKVHQDMGRPEDAIADLNKARQTLDRLVLDDPDDGKAINIKARVDFNIGTAHRSLKNNQQAAEAFRAAGESYAELVRREPTFVPYRAQLGASLSNQGTSLRLIGQYETGAALGREAISHQRIALSLRPEPSESNASMRHLRSHFILLIICERTQGHFEATDTAIQEFLTEFPKSVEAHGFASREYAQCSKWSEPSFFLSGRAKAEQYAKRSIAELRTAMDLDIDYTRKEFDPDFYKTMTYREDYKKLIDELKPDKP